MPDKRLIVNADDFNTDPQRNRGILEAASRGIVTSISLLANSALLESNLALFADMKSIGVGIHLNLTNGLPLCPEARSLLDDNGRFLRKEAAWRRALTNGFKLSEVKQELAAQVSRVLDAGISLDHMDGNNHLHVFPYLADVVAELAVDFGISRIRVPCEAFLRWTDCCRSGALKKGFFSMLGRKARRVFRRYGLKSPDYFAGLQVPRVCDQESLERFLRTLRPGTTELMCHPGYASAGASFSSADREAELAVLTSPEVIKATMTAGIRLCTFREL